MEAEDLKRARQTAAQDQLALQSAHARIRELETIAETLNRRLIAANERAQTAESQLQNVVAMFGGAM